MRFAIHTAARSPLYRLAVAWLLVSFAWPVRLVAAPRVFLWNAARLEENRQRVRDGDQRLAEAVERLRRDAQRAMEAGPFSVVNKDATPPSGDKHDYMSLGPYWWPNPDTPDGLPYVRRDGRRYPGTRDIPNRRDLGEMCDAVATLATAYFFTDDETYAGRAVLLIRTWFLDPDTRMNPHLDYGQAIRGRNTGRGIGIIETRGFARVVDAVGLLADSSAWTAADQQALQRWIAQYLHWLTESDHGRDEAAAENNHGTYYDIQVASFAAFVGKTKLAADVLRAAGPRRIAVQVEPDGSQPLELARTKAWGYSVANLKGLITLATMAEHQGIDLWHYQSDDGRGIRQAIDFLLPFASGDKEWPYQQLGGWSPRPFHPVLRIAAEKYPDGPYREALAKIPSRAASRRSMLIGWQLEQF